MTCITLELGNEQELRCSLTRADSILPKACKIKARNLHGYVWSIQQAESYWQEIASHHFDCIKKTNLGHTNRTADQNSPNVSMEHP